MNFFLHLIYELQSVKVLGEFFTFHRKSPNLCFKDEQKSVGFGKTWVWEMTEFSFLGELITIELCETHQP